jgi:SAM-dependent methyltransferase
MNELNEKQYAELDFWRNLLHQHGNSQSFIKFRTSEYQDKIIHFPKFEELTKGKKGIDLGCGLVSVFDDSDLDLIACDPLMDHYLKLIPQSLLKKEHRFEDGEKLSFPNESLDYIITINTIDHTPNPHDFVHEMNRTLKMGGLIFFEVNFDQFLATPHYGLWTIDTVNKYMARFKPLHYVKEPVPQHNQDRMWAVYQKVQA